MMMVTMLKDKFTVGLVLILTVVNYPSWTNADLIVNVRNQGGESYKQTIRANLTEETVKLYFNSYDGSTTTMIIDFRNEIQLVHTIRLGDQEENAILDEQALFESSSRGMKSKSRLQEKMKSPSVYKSYCFVTKFKPQEFIPVDAMAKLRQKNPWSLRTPERTEASQNITFDILLDPTASDWISPAIREECLSSPDNSFVTNTYAIKMEISERAVNPEDYLRAVRDIVVEDDGRGCGSNGGNGSLISLNKPCVCTATVCIGWYPCSLKFCRARSSSNSTSLMSGSNNVAGGASGSSSNSPSADNNNFKTYRCGIHTCRICRNYMFGATSGFECI